MEASLLALAKSIYYIQSYSQYRKNVDLLEQGPRGTGG